MYSRQSATGKPFARHENPILWHLHALGQIGFPGPVRCRFFGDETPCLHAVGLRRSRRSGVVPEPDLGTQPHLGFCRHDVLPIAERCMNGVFFT